jgi:hypothetical protein
LQRSEAAGDFLTKLHHAPVAFGLIVGEGHGEIVEEAQDGAQRERLNRAVGLQGEQPQFLARHGSIALQFCPRAQSDSALCRLALAWILVPSSGWNIMDALSCDPSNLAKSPRLS